MLEVNFEKYITFEESSSIDRFKAYSLTRRKLRYLHSQGVIRSIKKENYNYYSLLDIETYIKNYNEPIKLKSFFIEMFPSRKPNSILLKKFEEVLKNKNIEVDNFAFPPYNYRLRSIKKADITDFKVKYINFNDIFEMQNFTKSKQTFYLNLQEKNIEILKIASFYDYYLVDIEKYKSWETSRTEDVETFNVSKKLGFKTIKYIYDIYKEYNIKPYLGRDQISFILKTEFNFLINKQSEVLEYLNQNYYALSEIENIYKELGKSKAPSDKLATFEKVNVPAIARVGKYKNKAKLYSRKDVDNYLDRIKKADLLSKTFSTSSDDYLKKYLTLLNIREISNFQSASITMKHWNIYVETRIETCEGSHLNKMRKIERLVIITETLFNLLGSKEIFNLSNGELEISIFSQVNTQIFRAEVYRFLKRFNEVLIIMKIRPIDLSKFRNLKGKNQELEKEIYKLDDYLELCNYVANFKLHKNIMIGILSNHNKDIQSSHLSYASYWLYTLLHLNNAFRHQDVIDFNTDKISILEYFSISSIQDLEKLDIKKRDVELILKRYQLSWYKHNKNKELSPFYCSDLLSTSFVWAVIFCEYIKNQNKVLKFTGLIDFRTKNNLPNRVIKKKFFKEFNITDFNFMSRKMNRTLITYISSIIKDNSELDSINIARHLRGHVSIETTNCYVKIPQEHFDTLMLQVFEKGNFGYVYDLLYKRMMQKEDAFLKEDSRLEIIKSIKVIFGNVSNLEVLSNQITYIYNKREEAADYISSLSNDDVSNQLKKISLGLSPAKEHNFQCLFNTCLAIKYSCQKCPFAIPNWYELVSVGQRLMENIEKYDYESNQKNAVWGEQQKLYNFILSDLTFVLEAQEKFGEEVLNLVLKEDFEVVRSRLLNMTDPLNQRKLDVRYET